jgi:hypothetical protein
MIGARQEIVVAMDWSEFDHDSQSTLALNSHTFSETNHQRRKPFLRHGRDQVVEHAALAEQRMRAGLGRV